MTARLRALSGLGDKAAACFLVEAPGARLLLDLGAVAGPGGQPDLRGVGPVDAVLLGHLHPDHAAGLPLRAAVGNPPVHATDLTARVLRLADARPLPLCGQVQLCGVTVTTGRNGHAPGGVWLHLALGEGLLYCGDLGFSSDVYPLDAPPPAATVVLDASSGLAEAPAGGHLAALARALAAAEGPLLLPAPAWGRGVELALAAAGLGAPVAVDAPLRAALARLAGAPEALRPGAAARLAALAAGAEAAETAAPRAGLAVVASDPAAEGGATAAWAARLSGGAGAIRFTGHCPAGSAAARLLAAGRAGRLPWPVHPWLSENRALLLRLGARRAVAAFCDPRLYPALGAALAPAVLPDMADLAL